MAETKAEKRARMLRIKQKYEAQERRRNRILWGMFFFVIAMLLGVAAYNLLELRPGTTELKMPFIEERHRQLKENNPER